jgi:hypothetical protein
MQCFASSLHKQGILCSNAEDVVETMSCGHYLNVEVALLI